MDRDGRLTPYLPLGDALTFGCGEVLAATGATGDLALPRAAHGIGTSATGARHQDAVGGTGSASSSAAKPTCRQE
jgi:hypothetical protein